MSERSDHRKKDDQKEVTPEDIETPLHIFGREVYKADFVKFFGLIAFIVITVGLAVALWPMLSSTFEEGGVDACVAQIRDAGPWGVFILLAIQVLQVIVAFIPGEIVQAAAGVMYGPWIATLILLVGAALASSTVYALASKLGRPFVKRMIPDKYIGKLDSFEKSGKMDAMVFVLFLIPAMPKDVLTYIVPLTNMRASSFIAITTVARAPGILMTTYLASGLVDGNFGLVAILVAVIVLLCLVCIVFRDNIVSLASGNGVGDLRESVQKLGGLRNSAKAVREANKTNRAKRKKKQEK